MKEVSARKERVYTPSVLVLLTLTSQCVTHVCSSGSDGARSQQAGLTCGEDANVLSPLPLTFFVG